MENITTGHWIFAGIFMLIFIGFLIWSYRKDFKMHKMHYNNAYYVLVAMLLIGFVFYVFKRLF